MSCILGGMYFRIVEREKAVILLKANRSSFNDMQFCEEKQPLLRIDSK